ncbi:granulocyte colony-stimulating factor receptor [Pseudorasbora parva]|uniref:granulocyte colony-stimulating factor receptor n=1 Tax=Pseudorasbora parva TaxID=51549 RepID=UPI00351F7CC4
MASVRLVLVLWIYINVLIKVMQASLCAKIHTPASLVLAGSPVSVTCSIEEDCLLTKGKDFRVAWKIDNDFAPSNLSYQESKRTYGILIPSLQRTADIVCVLCVADNNCQIVDGVTVDVGYLPTIPKNLSCALNKTQSSRLLCRWDPGQEKAILPTKYILHVSRANSEKSQYEIPPGQHLFLLPRNSYDILSEVEVYVTAVNVLGNATSAPLKLIPYQTAKLYAPVIKRFEALSSGCLRYSWSLSPTQEWLQFNFSVELRLSNQTEKELVVPFGVYQGNTIKVCGLRHGTNYTSTLRVNYGSWSEWSKPITATTLMRVPAGQLETWLKVNDQDAQLYWKPSKHFRANGWNLSYTVNSNDQIKPLCETQGSHCFFNLTKGIKKVYLRAKNAVGSSNHTQVTVYRKKGLGAVSNFRVLPQSETSVLTVWERPESSGVTGYVLEWRALCEKPAAPLSFSLIDKNNSSAIITGLSPYMPYNISVYPKYEDGIGSPLTLMAYSSQKAPSVAPNLTFVDIRHSEVELGWDEIPLEQRNGIIQGYTIYIWSDRGDLQEINTEMTNILVENLKPLTVYYTFICVHTMGGSTNGTIQHRSTGHTDGMGIVFFVIPASIGLALLFIIVVFTCFGKHERVKMCLWPIIPDPANSSIKKWTATDSLQGLPTFKEDKDPVLVYLSHFSLLDLSEKEPLKSDYVKESQWSRDIDSRNESHNSFQDRSSYDSTQDRDSVPYATVVFGSSYQSHSSPMPAYVRSDSTQPLLEGDDPGSPPPYENVSLGRRVPKVKHFNAFPLNSTQSEENEEVWEEFPMLKSLEIGDTDHN